MDWFLRNRNLLHDRVNALLLECIHGDIFLDYDIIIDIYASKYPRMTLLVNPLSENYTAEMFNARKTYNGYTDFLIFSIYFMIVIGKNFCFVSAALYFL